MNIYKNFCQLYVQYYFHNILIYYLFNYQLFKSIIHQIKVIIIKNYDMLYSENFQNENKDL